MASIQVTISLPEDVYQRAQRFSRLINRDLASVLAETVGSSLPPMSERVESLPAIAELSDRAVLDIADSMLPTQQDQRLSELLAKQREGELVANETQELEALMQVYNEGWLRKTAGLVEAVKRGLMNPMDS